MDVVAFDAVAVTAPSPLSSIFTSVRYLAIRTLVGVPLATSSGISGFSFAMELRSGQEGRRSVKRLLKRLTCLRYIGDVIDLHNAYSITTSRYRGVAVCCTSARIS